jgi:hypothetical protein
VGRLRGLNPQLRLPLRLPLDLQLRVPLDLQLRLPSSH